MISNSPSAPLHLVLADDDTDDRSLFKEALNEIPLSINITTVHDGEQLMTLLNRDHEPLPQVIFLDLNMPCKNGFECLTEIKLDERLKSIPVIIFSTSFQKEVVKLLYMKGAQYYICKPDEYHQLKKVIANALVSILKTPIASQPPLEKFVLSCKQFLKE